MMAGEDLRSRRAHTESRWRDAGGRGHGRVRRARCGAPWWSGCAEGGGASPRIRRLLFKGQHHSTEHMALANGQTSPGLSFPICIMEIMTISTSEGDCED